MTDFVKIITEYGMEAVLVAYLIFRDYKFTSRLEAIMQKMSNFLDRKEEN